MKAAVLGEQGVEIRDLPKPEPKPNEVLIRVRASSLNRADALVASGIQHGSVGGVGARIGLECSGEIEAVGGEVKDFKPGDRVHALRRPAALPNMSSPMPAGSIAFPATT